VFFDFLNKITQLIQRLLRILLWHVEGIVCVVAPGDASGKMPAALTRLIYHLSFLFTFAPHSGTPNSISRALVSGYAHTKASESCHPANLFSSRSGPHRVSQEISSAETEDTLRAGVFQSALSPFQPISSAACCVLCFLRQC
jgi:hypothetical protein